MSIKDRLAAKSATIGERPRTPKDEAPFVAKTAVGQLSAFRPILEEKENEIKSLNEKLLAAQSGPSSLELLLSDLYEVPGRRRKLTIEQFNELVENLRNNPLVTAITVRPRTTGGYEIISGHNRVAAFKQLARLKILSVVQESDDNQAELSAFYANLIQPSLPDFEKFLGFKTIQKIHPDLTQEQIAKGAGVSQEQVSKLLSFDKLPNAALTLLQNAPEALGAQAAAALAASKNKAHEGRIVEAVQKIINKEMTQEQAVKFALATEAKEGDAPKKSAPVTIKSGRNKFCEIYKAPTNKTFRIEFVSAEEGAEIMKEIQVLIENRASIANKKHI